MTEVTVNNLLEMVESMYQEGKDKHQIWEELNSYNISDLQLDTLVSILQQLDEEYFIKIINKINSQLGVN